MKNLLLILLMFISIEVFCQNEGQNFCKGISDGSYFPLNIQKKKIYWYNTYYIEELVNIKNVNGTDFKQYKQVWKNGNIDYLYLKEENNKVVQFYEENNEISTRYDSSFKVDYSWRNNYKNVVYTIKSYDAKLVTPYCVYENLLIIEAKYEKITFNFYYLKGLGYIGATENGELISFITPKM